MKTCFAFASVLLVATSAAAQTTTTTTKTTTTTTTSKWQSPDGTRGGSSSTTSTNTQSKSKSIGTIGHRPGLPNPTWNDTRRPTGYTPFAGGWRLAAGKGRPCMITLHQGFDPRGGGAVTSGCGTPDLKAVGNWTMPDGYTLTLTKSLVSTVATLRNAGHGRFEGVTSAGEPIAMWR
jgi:hypothetical protein